jgi:hypothetical protein
MMNDYESVGPTRPPAAHRRTPSTKKRGRFIAATLMAAVIGVCAGCATSSSATTASSPPATSSPATFGQRMPGGGSNARSGPAAGGTSGTVDSVSASSFTLTTAADQKVAVNETSATTYQNGASATSASVIAKGTNVLVLGTTNATTITATQINVQSANGDETAASRAAGVIPFQRGAPTTSKQVGQIPPNYTEGSGTIVGGVSADKATEAALGSYPGGVVDRVVKLSSGDYEVHYIGVNWPHHIFVNQEFKVIGAD